MAIFAFSNRRILDLIKKNVPPKKSSFWKKWATNPPSYDSRYDSRCGGEETRDVEATRGYVWHQIVRKDQSYNSSYEITIL